MAGDRVKTLFSLRVCCNVLFLVICEVDGKIKPQTIRISSSDVP